MIYMNQELFVKIQDENEVVAAVRFSDVSAVVALGDDIYLITNNGGNLKVLNPPPRQEGHSDIEFIEAYFNKLNRVLARRNGDPS